MYEISENLELPEEVVRIARELSLGKHRSADELASATRVPKWKVARVLKRLESLGFARSSREVRFAIGRPRKFYTITEDGIKFFKLERSEVG